MVAIKALLTSLVLAGWATAQECKEPARVIQYREEGCKGLDDNNGSCHTRDVAAAWRMKSFKITWHHLDSCWIAYELYLGKRCGGVRYGRLFNDQCGLINRPDGTSIKCFRYAAEWDCNA